MEDIQTLVKNIGIEKLEEVFTRFYNIREEALRTENNRKKKEKDLQEEIAMSKQYYKKDNTPDISKVKMAVFKEAMKVFLFSEPNKLQEKLELMEEYIADLKNDDSLKSKAEELSMLIAEEKAVKEGIKEVKDEYRDIYDKEILDALDDIAKEKIEELKREEKGEKVNDNKGKKEGYKAVLREYLK